MTFEEWWNNDCNAVDEHPMRVAKSAWDSQQTVIDELQYLNNLQQDRIDELETQWRDDASLTISYLKGFSDGKKAAQEQG